jgi:hypothetical protein
MLPVTLTSKSCWFIDGDMRLVLPLDERESILDIDLNLKDNRLSALNDKVVIEGYNSSDSIFPRQD